MATPAQIEANRKNAQKSTGPKTEEGKARSKMNALTHGFTSDQAVIDPLEQQLFPQFAEAITRDLNPQNAIELTLVDQIISCSWRLRRVLRIESEHLRSYFGKEGTTLGQSLLAGDQHRKLFALSSHEARVQRALHRAIEDLHRLRQTPRPETEPQLKQIGWQQGGSATIEAAEHEFKWLHETSDAYFDLLKQARSFEKIWRELREVMDNHENLQYNIRELLKQKPSKARDKKLANEQALLWKSEKELTAYIETIQELRKEIKSTNEPNSLFDRFEQRLYETLDRHLPEDAEDEEEEEIEEENRQPLEEDTRHEVEEARAEPVAAEFTPPAPGSVAPECPVPAAQIAQSPSAEATTQTASINPQSPIIDPPGAAEFILPGSAAQATERDETPGSIGGNAAPAQRPLNPTQAAVLKQLRKYQVRLHEARQLPSGSEKHHAVVDAHRMMTAFQGANAEHLIGVPKDLITFDPARDLPAP